MSSFICDKCGILNIDSDNGYIEGCKHYAPKNEGTYLVKYIGTDGKVKEATEYLTILNFNTLVCRGSLVKWIKEA